MKDSSKIIELLRCFSYSMELPVKLESKGEPVYSLPKNIRKASDVCDNKHLSDLPTEGISGISYYRTEADENFVLLNISEEDCVIVGPFLTEAISPNHVTNMIREGKIGFHFRTEMESYYNSLPVLSEQRYYYCGQLLETLFKDNSISAIHYNNEEDTPATFITPEYYQQTNDYRMEQFSHSPYVVEQEICRTISNGDTERAKYILNEINRRPRARLAGTAIRSLKNSIICSCTFMARAAISGGVNPDDAFTLSDTYIQNIEKCEDIKDLLNIEETMVSGYTALVNALRKSRYSNAVNQALVYIDTHLCEPIFVTDIANAVYLNPNYLSGLFKKETGETIHSWIIRKRVEEASFFVRSSSESIAEIATFYQFSSQSHFVQSFKQIMGVTPGVYRREVTGEK